MKEGAYKILWFVGEDNETTGNDGYEDDEDDTIDDDDHDDVD